MNFISDKMLRAVNDFPLPDSPIIPRISFLLRSNEIPLTNFLCSDDTFKLLTEINLDFIKIYF